MQYFKSYKEYEDIKNDISRICESDIEDMNRLLYEYIIENNIDENVASNILKGIGHASKMLYTGVFGNMLALPTVNLGLHGVVRGIKGVGNVLGKVFSRNKSKSRTTTDQKKYKYQEETNPGYDSLKFDNNKTQILITSPRTKDIMKQEYFIKDRFIMFNGVDKTLVKNFMHYGTEGNVFLMLRDVGRMSGIFRIWKNSGSYIDRYKDEYKIHFRLYREDYFIDIYVKNPKPDIQSTIKQQLAIYYSNILRKEVRGDFQFTFDPILMRELFVNLLRDITRYNTNK